MATIRRLRWTSAAAAASLIVVAPIGTAAAGAATVLDNGGAFCLRVGTSEPGATRVVLALDVDPADHPTKRKLWWVSGYEKGTNPDVVAENYVDTLSGTATVAKPNDGLRGRRSIELGLTGQGSGASNDPGVTGLWQHTYSLRLNPKTLKGRITGLTVFTPITGDTVGVPTQVAVDAKVKRVKCASV